MIKAGIAGAGSSVAGELIRILINHPEVELVRMCAPEFSGRGVSSVHHGLIGELDKDFSDHIVPEELDVLFLCASRDESVSLTDRIDSLGLTDLRIVDLSGGAYGKPDFVCGVSEIFRKPMVRGTKRAYIPSAAAAVALISLYPLAANLLLSQDIEIKVSAPEGMDMTESSLQTESVLRSVQNSFCGAVRFCHAPDGEDDSRGMRIRFSLPVAMPIEEIVRLYEGIYDDHNFTYLSSRRLDKREAAGTHKCLISLMMPEPGRFEADAVADAHMRGGAGDAVHAMNLLFGLHERTGLTLKASHF